MISSGLATIAFRERLPLEQLHHDERLTAGVGILADLVDGADIGVIQRRGRARLAAQPLDCGRMITRLRRQHLDRHLPSERDVLGTEDEPHAAAAELIDDPVVREGAADHQGPGIRD